MMEPVHIVQQRELNLKGRKVEQVKVLWDHNYDTFATWEDAREMKALILICF